MLRGFRFGEAHCAVSHAVLSHTGLECYESAPKFERREGVFDVKEPSFISLSEDGAVLFVTSEDLRTAHTFATVSGKGVCSLQLRVL